MDETTKEIMKLKLDSLFNNHSWFDICKVNDIGRLIGANVKLSPGYKKLKALHCVHYSDMSSTLKNEVSKLVMECLSSRVDTDTMARAILAVKNGEIKDQPFIEDCDFLKLGVIKDD